MEKLVHQRQEECDNLDKEFNALINELNDYKKENEAVYTECAEKKKLVFKSTNIYSWFETTK